MNDKNQHDDPAGSAPVTNWLTGGDPMNGPSDPAESGEGDDSGQDDLSEGGEGGDPNAAYLSHLEAQLAEYEKFAPVLHHLKNAGFEDGSQVLDRFAAHQTQTQVAEWMAQVQHELQTRVDKGEITPEAALGLYQREQNLVAREAEAAHFSAQYQHLQNAHFENQIHHATSAHGLDEDGGLLVRLGASAGVDPHAFAPALAQMLRARDEQVAQKALADYAAGVTGKRHSPAPALGGAPPATAGGKRASSGSWASILGFHNQG